MLSIFCDAVLNSGMVSFLPLSNKGRNFRAIDGWQVISMSTNRTLGEEEAISVVCNKIYIYSNK